MKISNLTNQKIKKLPKILSWYKDEYWHQAHIMFGETVKGCSECELASHQEK